MIDTGSLVFDALCGDTTLVALLGSTDQIVPSYPEEITTFPLVIFRELDQPDSEFADNLPTNNNSTYSVDVFARDDTPTPISVAVANIFRDMYWSCIFNTDIPDASTGVRHRTMHFTKMVWSSEL
jgi:hypothetical protein